MSRKREHRVLFMVITMVIFYLLCWLPYGIMALMATFGAPGLVTVEASIVPSILAKFSTAINPVIYIFMNKQVSMKRDVTLYRLHKLFCIFTTDIIAKSLEICSFEHTDVEASCLKLTDL